ncbi:hypothetical protein GCM10022221_67840 [Actinocorallia aurea]
MNEPSPDEATQQTLQGLAALQTTLTAVLGPALTRFAEQVKLISLTHTQVATGMMEGLKPLFETLSKLRLPEGWAPPNWGADNPYGEVVGDRRLETVFSILLDDGIPLSYVPRKDIVQKLVAADGRAERVGILVARTVDIVEDCRLVLAEVTQPELSGLAGAAAVAVDALDHGLHGPAQSHASNLFDRLLRDLAKRGLLVPAQQKYVYKTMQTSLAAHAVGEGMTFSQFRTATAVSPAVQALAEYWPDKGDPVPAVFSRHATAHDVHNPVQVNAGNALIAVMLVVSLLREIQEEGW